MREPQAVTLTQLIPALRSAQVDVTVHVSSTLNVTAYTARQKVGGLALSKIGTGIGADEPELIMSRERIVWRVPVFLALPGLGRLGNIGAIDVDAQTGEVLADDHLIETLIRNARQLPLRDDSSGVIIAHPKSGLMQHRKQISHRTS